MDDRAGLFRPGWIATISVYGLGERTASRVCGVAWSILKCAHPIFTLEGGLDGLPLRVSNEGLRRPRVARAQETI